MYSASWSIETCSSPARVEQGAKELFHGVRLRKVAEKNRKKGEKRTYAAGGGDTGGEAGPPWPCGSCGRAANWRSAAARARPLANHIDIQDKIGIFAHNMPRWTITDIGTLQIRAVTVPIYATNTAKQAQFIINNADMKIIFVGDQEQYDQVLEIVDECPKLEKIVAMKNTIHLHEHAKACHWQDFIEMADEQYQAELQQRLDGKCLEDLFTLIYTSVG